MAVSVSWPHATDRGEDVSPSAALLFHGADLQLLGDPVAPLRGGNVGPRQFADVLAR